MTAGKTGAIVSLPIKTPSEQRTGQGSGEQRGDAAEAVIPDSGGRRAENEPLATIVIRMP
jgi:hypothetical protein